MSTISRITTWASLQTLTASALNNEFNNVINYLNNADSGSSTWASVSTGTLTATSTVSLSGTVTNTASSGNTLVWDTSTLIVDATNHRVGIGTTSPSARLQVTGASDGVAMALFGAATNLVRIVPNSGNITFDATNNAQGAFVPLILNGSTLTLQTGGSNAVFISSGQSVSIGNTSPLATLHVGPGSGALVGTNLQLINNQNGSTGIACHNSSASIETAMFAEASAAGSIGTTTNHNFKIFTNNTLVATFFATGGVNIGSPTGGDKGAATLNITNDIFKNNAAYTNPDYVLEKWVTGKVEKFIGNPGASDYPGLMSIDDLEAYMREHLDLPRVKSLHVEGGGQGIFGRGDIALEKIEELFIYIIQIHKRIKKIEEDN